MASTTARAGISAASAARTRKLTVRGAMTLARRRPIEACQGLESHSRDVVDIQRMVRRGTGQQEQRS